MSILSDICKAFLLMRSLLSLAAFAGAIGSILSVWPGARLWVGRVSKDRSHLPVSWEHFQWPDIRT